MTDHSTNDLVRRCLMGIADIKARDKFDYQTFYPSGEGIVVQKESEGPIDDLTLLPNLVGLLNTTPNKKVYWWVQLILYRLLRNTKSADIGETIIDLIKAETEDWKIEILVGAIEDNGGFTDRVAELAYLLDHRSSYIRSSILYAFRHTTSSAIERPLAKVLATSKDSHKLWLAAMAMRKVGTATSLPILEPLLYHKKQDIQIVVLGAIAGILKKDGCNLYIKMLDDKRYREKWAAISYIHTYCGESAALTVIKRIKKLLQRKRSPRTIHRQNDGTYISEFMQALEFVNRYAPGNPEIDKLYQYVKKRWDYVLPAEQEFITANIEAFHSVRLKSEL